MNRNLKNVEIHGYEIRKDLIVRAKQYCKKSKFKRVDITKRLKFKEKFDKNNICRENIITASLKSGYQNKSFCDKHKLPKTLTEFYLYLKKNNMSSELLKNNIVKSLKKYFSLFKFCKKDPPKNFKTKHLFGPDIIIQENLDCKILEVNTAPDLFLRYKNLELEYQREIKKELHHSYRKSDYSNNFIKLH